ncbi:hypothetical protein [Tenacibaculum halocynthiae]|uniref:hypothetical protein n=1 Tax=Tenacibaculum halocynthiae TaxID=1254437 RepID=UPI003D6559C9
MKFNFSFKRMLGIIFAILSLLYIVIEYKYDYEILVFFSLSYSFFILVDSVRYLLKRKDLVEIGELEFFNKKYVDFVYLLLLIFFIFFLLPKVLEFLKFKGLRNDFNFTLIIFAPQLLQFIIGVFSKEVGTFLYITERGLLSSMDTRESYFWDDFINYKIINDQKLFRFEKKNNKYLFISYDEKYFENNKKEILGIIKQNLVENE